MSAWLAAVAVVVLPGAVFYRIPFANRPLRAAFSAEERGFWSVVLSLTWSIAAVLALAWVGSYTLPRLLAINAAASLAILAVFRTSLAYSPGEALRPSWSLLLPVGLIALGAWLYFPPAEYVIGGKDPGVYLNEGVQIAQRGDLVAKDPEVAAVPPEFRNLFFPSHQNPQYYGNRFMGFFILNADDGRVVGQFPQLLPASIALGYGLHGLDGARQAIGAWAILGLVAVYFVAARLFNPAVAVATSVLVAINIVEIWFARYPNSEIPMQALLFAATLAFSRALDGGQSFFGGLAGCLLGLMLFLRVDVVLAFGSFAAAAVLATAIRARVGAAFGIALALSGLVGLGYLLGPMRAYTSYPLGFFMGNGGLWLLAGGALAAWASTRLLRWPRLAAFVRPALPATLAVVLVGLAAYAYFFREQAGRLALGDAMAFRAFGWFVHPWVLALAVVSGAIVIATRFWRDPAFFLTFATFSVFFFYKTRIVPEYFWTTRRFLAITLPGVLLFAVASAELLSALFQRLVSARRNGRYVARNSSSAAASGATEVAPYALSSASAPINAVLRAVLVIAVAAPIAVVFWSASAPVRPHVEYAGMVSQLERLATAVGQDDLLLVEARNAGSDLHTLAVPLAYIYGRHVLLLNSAVPAKRMFEGFIDWARSRYAHVLFLGGGGTDLLTRTVAAVPIAGDLFQVPEYSSVLNAYPSGVRFKEYEFGLYRLVPAASTNSTSIDLPIGALDDLNVVRFYAREKRPDGTPFRWSGAQSFILLQGIGTSASRLTIWMSHGGRPPQAAPATVEVAWGELPIGTATPHEDEVKPYVFDLPPALVAEAAASQDPVRLRLRVPTWTPSAMFGGDDTRNLGVVVTRVQVQ